jgi:hypothetical protein
MLSITRGSARPGEPGRRRTGAPFAVSLAVNAVVVVLLLRALMPSSMWSRLTGREQSAEIRAERIGFVQLPAAGPAQAVREGGDGRPVSRTRTRAPAAPRAAAPTSVPTELPPAGPPQPAEQGGTGPVVGRGGAVEGLRPTYSDPRLWTRPGGIATAPRSAKERIDSVIADKLTPVRDSMVAAAALAAGQRAPGDWTMNGPGGRWGMDQSNIHLGKVKIPNAVLALLSGNLQKNLRGNPTEMANDRRMSEIRSDLLLHAQREMGEDEFRNAVKQIRERKDRERAARLLARQQQQGGDATPAEVRAGAPMGSGAGSTPER